MVLLAGKLFSSFLLSNFVFLGNCFQAARAPPRVQVKKTNLRFPRASDDCSRECSSPFLMSRSTKSPNQKTAPGLVNYMYRIIRLCDAHALSRHFRVRRCEGRVTGETLLSLSALFFTVREN